MRNSVLILLLLCVCLTTLSAQVPPALFHYDDLGPYNVSQVDSFIPWGAVNVPIPPVFQNVPISGFVGYRLYWPDGLDPAQTTPDLFAGSPFPLLVFNHGWASNPGDYDGLMSHLTSWGFVVAVVNYNVFPVEIQRPIEQAYESWLLKNYLISEACNPNSTHPVHGVLAPDPNQPVAAAGHSMGAVASIFLAGVDSSIDTLVMMEPFEQSQIGVFGTCSPLALFNGSAAAEPFAQNYTGAAYLFEGNDDQLVNNSVDMWFNKFNSGSVVPRRLVQLSVDGVGHFGCTDVALATQPYFPCGITNLGDMGLLDQHLVHRRFITTTLLSEFLDESFENNFIDLFGDGFRDESFDSLSAGGPVQVGFTVQSACPDAIIWAQEVNTPWNAMCPSMGTPIRPNSLAFGVLGLPGDYDATYVLIPLTLLGGACLPGGFVYDNFCVLNMYSNLGNPANVIGASGVRECNFGIVSGGVTASLVSYLWRNGPFDLTRLASFSLAP